MASSYKEIPLTFEKGLVTEIEESILDSGQASELTNWEATPQGGLRARNAWEPITTDGLTAPYNVRGFGAIATGTAVAGAVAAPVVVQKDVWPNGDGDPVATKTITLNGCNVGNVMIVVATDDSGNTPTVSGGWTERAISTGDKQYVKFYTKTADSSTMAFTYTIAEAKLRSLTMYEMKYVQDEDPGTHWAASSQFGAGSGTDSVTVNADDADGSFGIVGYLYDGGTPDTSDSGTSGWTTPTDDGGNTRTGVQFEDLDLLDGKTELVGANLSISYTSPSWTPPATGILIILLYTAGSGATTTAPVGSPPISVTGNGLTWHYVTDGGELLWSNTTSYGGHGYAWADLSLVSPTTGAISVTINRGGGTPVYVGLSCSFVRAIGGDQTDPFIQKAIYNTANDILDEGPTLVALTDGSGVLGQSGVVNNPASAAPPNIGAGNWQGQLDSFDLDNTELSANFVNSVRTAYINSAFGVDAKATWDFVACGTADEQSVVSWEIRGAGNAGKTYHGGVAAVGSMTENFGYVANKRIVAKMVSWGFTPPSVSADTVDFFIVMAVATDATSYKVYRIPREEITTGTWEQIDVVTDAISTNEFVSFAQGAGHLIWSASPMNYPRAIELATLSQFNITDLLGLAGRTAVYHKDRMFMAGTTQNPSRVYFSDIGDPNDWTTTTDFMDIGGDDGEAIQDLLSVEGLLLIPKTNRAYLVSGSGVESFFVNELPGGTAATGRSAVRTPFGTILAGTDDIWVVQGGGVDPMSRPLGDGYRITGAASTAYGQDTVLVADSGTNTVWRVNLVTGAWMYETVTGDDAAFHIGWSLNGRLYYGTNDSTTQVGGTRQLLSPRNVDLTTGDTHFTGATGRLALDGPAFQYTPRYLFLQTRAQDPTLYNELHVTLTTNLNLDTPYETTIPVTEATQRDRITMAWAKGAEWLKVGFRCESSATAAAIDVEKIVLGVDVEAPR